MPWRPKGWSIREIIMDVCGTSLVTTGWDAKMVEAGADAIQIAIIELCEQWLGGLHIDDDCYEGLFAYGGPPSCEYGCLAGLIDVLRGGINDT